MTKPTYKELEAEIKELKEEIIKLEKENKYNWDKRAEVIQQKSDIKQKLLAEMDGDKIYPKDIYPELTDHDLTLIHHHLKTKMSMNLDRLSAHITRTMLNNFRQSINKIFSEDAEQGARE